MWLMTAKGIKLFSIFNARNRNWPLYINMNDRKNCINLLLLMQAEQRLPIPTWSSSDLLVCDWWLQREKVIFNARNKNWCGWWLQKERSYLFLMQEIKIDVIDDCKREKVIFNGRNKNWCGWWLQKERSYLFLMQEIKIVDCKRKKLFIFNARNKNLCDWWLQRERSYLFLMQEIKIDVIDDCKRKEVIYF